MKILCVIFFIFVLQSCKKEDPNNIGMDSTNTPSLYYPPLNTNNWETIALSSLNWNSQDTTDLFNFLSQNKTRAFILLKDGKIVVEKYWGNNFQNSTAFNRNSIWYWASAGKTLTAFLVGIAQEQGLLNINNKTSDYLGKHWTSLSQQKEDLILVRHQLTMTTGLDYNISNLDCTLPSCLKYKADAGTQWFYHNATYTLLTDVVSNASGQTYNEFTKQQIESKIGMNGNWVYLTDNHIFWSTARDAARFGLLLLSKGKWAGNQILADKNYLQEMTNSSQSLNPSYGYLTWLNGKSSIILPGLPNSFNTSLSLYAPSDLFAAIGKNGQYIDVIPSKKMVVIRMGEAPDSSQVPTVFHDNMWKKINALVN